MGYSDLSGGWGESEHPISVVSGRQPATLQFYADVRSPDDVIAIEGPIDSINHWTSLTSGGGGTPPRKEIVLAGIDSDKSGAAIRIGDYKLLVGAWGADTWCDLNITGFSPEYPAPIDPNPSHGPGGEGGLYCAKLPNSSMSALSLAWSNLLPSSIVGSNGDEDGEGVGEEGCCSSSPHTDYTDSNITAIPKSKIDDCCSSCAGHKGCAVSVYNKETETCYLKASAKGKIAVKYGAVATIPSASPSPPKPNPSSWTSVIKGLYNVVKDPRELTDLQQQMPQLVATMHARLMYWNGTTVPTIHNRTSDPKAELMLKETECMSPWQDWPGMDI